MNLLLFINISRLHPLVVHLPIGILFFVFFLELWKRWKKEDNLNGAIELGLLIGGLSSIAAALTGWFLGNEGGYDEAMLSNHKWAGIGTMVLSLILYFSHRSKNTTLQKVYFPTFLATILALTLTGHFGGNMTHGEDYLFSENSKEKIQVTDIQTAQTFDDIIFPIIKNKCMACHKAGKKKGGLLMTTAEALIKGGDSGNLFDFKIPGNSLILKRVHLPLEDEEHMPPKGKKQLEKDEIKLLEWWIKNKACFDCKVGEMEDNETIESILKKYEQPADNFPSSDKFTPINTDKIKDLRIAGINIHPLEENSPLLSASISGQKAIKKSTLKKITSVGQNIVELDLSNSSFSDKDAFVFEETPHLRILHLQNTNISAKVIEELTKLEHLKRLNIYGTKIGDNALTPLQNIVNLKKLFCWNTEITEEGIQQLENKKPKLEVQFSLSDELFGIAELQKPEIISEGDFFGDSMTIELKTNFPKTKIFYTLNGEVPDSNAILYNAPFQLKKSASLRAIALKKGWGDSPVSEKEFIQYGIAIKDLKLGNSPNKNYAGKGASTLFDETRGSTDFKDGNWLGYQGQHISSKLNLGNKKEISNIYVSTLAAPGSWIIFPKAIKVWSSENGVDFKEESKIDLSETSPDINTEQKIFRLPVSFSAQYIKVEIESPIKLPKWHQAAGNDCWVFVDEIILN